VVLGDNTGPEVPLDGVAFVRTSLYPA
jgi:hypothetical protein